MNQAAAGHLITPEEHVEIPPELNYSKKQVQRAGEILIQENISSTNPDAYSEAMRILSNWRSCHIHPLDVVTDNLAAQALKIDKNAVIAKRLKRTPSIIKKLKRFNGMKLRTMQDIGGCRAIVRTKKQVYKLIRIINKDRKYRIKNYIEHPKQDGYRGVHLIGKFSGKEKHNDYSIEVQVRTIIQHAWATAVEIIDIFTNQALKSNQGDPDWKDFFRYAGEEFSILDNNSEEFSDNAAEVERLWRKLNVYKKLVAYSSSLKIINDHINTQNDGFHLLIIDANEKTISIQFYVDGDFNSASQAYLDEEKKNVKNKSIVVALVSSNSINSLKEAYPNYFADSRVFVDKINIILAKNKVKNPGWLMQLMLDFNKSEREQ